MAIKDIGKFECKHNQKHLKVKVLVCKWCGEKFERPVCWPKETKFCSSWCARRYYQKNYSNKNSKNYIHGKTTQGYKRVNVNGKRMLEHRAIVEESIGRKLKRSEWIHHLNGIKTDNRPENLIIVRADKHLTVIICPHCGLQFGIK